MRKLLEASISKAKQRFEPGKNKPTIVMTDVIGEMPSRGNIAELDSALSELDAMTGLEAVKRAVRELVTTAASNYDKEIRGEQIDLMAMNYLFLGNPGTDKMSVAKVLFALSKLDKVFIT